MGEKAKRRTTAIKVKKSPLSKAMKDAFILFLERHPPNRVSHNLTSLLLEFISIRETSDLPYLQDLAFDLQGLFELLDLAERETDL